MSVAHIGYIALSPVWRRGANKFSNFSEGCEGRLICISVERGETSGSLFY